MIKNQIATHQKKITIKKLWEDMAFEPWSLRPDYSAIPLFYNFTKSHVSVFRITVYILISALQNLEKKTWG